MSDIPAQCRSCQAPIVVRKTPAGTLESISVQTGESHVIDCPQARHWRTRVAWVQPSMLGEDEAPPATPERRRTWEG